MTPMLIVMAALLLAATNGANDNFKGVATLWGSRVLAYRGALALASITVFAGCLVSLLIGTSLAARFSGKGLVDSAILSDPSFLISVMVGACLTLLMATRVGLPVSTTHALLGGLVGGGLAAGGLSGVRLARLAQIFLLPLLLSPVLAAMASSLIYRGLRLLRVNMGLDESSCVCVEPVCAIQASASFATMPAKSSSSAEIATFCNAPIIGLRGTLCRAPDHEGLVGIRIAGGLDSLHLLSAGAVGTSTSTATSLGASLSPRAMPTAPAERRCRESRPPAIRIPMSPS